MTKSTNKITLDESLSSLKYTQRISRDGYSFDVESDVWILNKDLRITFQHDVLEIETRTLNGFRKTLARYAEESSASHTVNMYMRFQRMVRDTGCKSINDNVILNWRGKLNDDTEWYLGALRGFLISWYDYGYSGMSKSVVDTLESMTLAGNKKGVAVANECPYSGALTQNEQIAVMNELIRLFEESSISLPCYSYLATLQATARRAVQLRQLKAVDLIKEYDSVKNAFNYYLNIPRSKIRGGGFRGEFRKLSITEDLYLTLLNLVEQESAKMNKLLGSKLDKDQMSLIPIFVDWPLAEIMIKNFQYQNVEMQGINDLLATDVLHMSRTYFRDGFMRQVNRLLEATSERTGDIIHLSARRFRRTRGTNLARKGVGPLIIAEALDHLDTQNVKVYTENTADTVVYIDQAVGKKLAPFANTFMGRIIKKVHDGERGDDPTGHVPNKDNEVVGACGTHDFCVKGYESCYLCGEFRPLLDAPHEKFLNALYAEKEVRLKATNNEQYASTKDQLILAVEWVVQACADMKAAKGGDHE